MSVTPQGFVPPPYPYDRLDGLRHHAERFSGGVIDLSIGTPFDAPAASVVAALANSGAERGYPPSIGSEALRSAAARWMNRRFSIDVPISAIAACVGSKEFVATVPQWLRLRSPGRDTVLFPEVAYPSYEMGATLAGCRAVAVPANADGVMDLDAISADDAARALALWVNSPANPSGALDDLGAAAAWGRAHGVPVLSDECYAEFTWDGPARTILEHGLDGVIALHSLSKRSNLAGARVAFYAGDPELVHYLAEVRKHAGMMMPGPVQAAGVVALDDDEHVAEQRDRYLARLDAAARAIGDWSGVEIGRPAGGFYLWFRVGDAWGFAERLAVEGGCLVSPGEFYGKAGRDHVRVAVVTSIDRIDLLAARLSGGGDR
ncbi:MAG: aminotransferase class I/II-fold pyridoxal phosphate-dependent enzyme [Actinomycetota bacterium]|nr:aminotransferase class I/II-fold pyridoxal phosphate-dependent enzyme [Actinomycetota bacterium]